MIDRPMTVRRVGPPSDSTASTERPLRWLATIECWLGGLCLLMAVITMFLWRSSNPSEAPHGGLLLLVSAPLFGLWGVAWLIAGATLRRADRWRWVGHIALLSALIVLSRGNVLLYLTGVTARLLAP